MKDYTKTGKFLSLILRHHPESIGIHLDENGWAEVPALLAGLRQNGHPIDRTTLEEIVATNNKKRYAFNEDKTKIRANQGHSIQVQLDLQPTQPPDILYHGTADRFYENILQKGLKKQNRNHVHLSADLETAISAGKRHGRPVVLEIEAQKMYHAGYDFYLAVNGVWLVDEVPEAYIRTKK